MKRPRQSGFGRLSVILALLLSVITLSAWGFFGLQNHSDQADRDVDWLRSIDSEHVSPETWGSIQLAMHKADGSEVSINLLRPLWWLAEADAQVGGTIFLSMPEMGIEGDAEVLEIGPCTVVADVDEPGQQVVTGTFCHQNAVVLDLYFDASPEPLSATASHPFWSASREDWVEAGELELGEYVATRDGIVQLTRRALRPGLHKVYNIEVHQTHNYYVSNLGILVHNGCAKGGAETTRIRHYTSRNGGKGIEGDGVIKASDQNTVFAERAKGKPLSPRDAETRYGLNRGHGRDIVETDVPSSRVKSVKNPKTKVKELQIEGDVPLDNATITQRR